MPPLVMLGLLLDRKCYFVDRLLFSGDVYVLSKFRLFWNVVLGENGANEFDFTPKAFLLVRLLL